METPGTTLRHEHEAILDLLEAVEGIVTYIESEGAVPTDDLERVLLVVTEFADRCHHAKEEAVLFPVLSEASPQRGAELARRLTSDHKAMRKLVGTIRDLLPKADDAEVRAQLAKNLATYPRLLREHIRIENEALLAEVDASLSSEEQERVARAFERVEAEEIGPGKHEEYHEIIHRLVDRYAA